MLSHTVYFTLLDDSPTAIQQLVDGCHQYLKNHPGIAYFAVGTLANEFTRPVNDRMNDVALHIFFTDKEAHDVYQVNEQHNQFIATFSPNWKQVRVFDAWVNN